MPLSEPRLEAGVGDRVDSTRVEDQLTEACCTPICVLANPRPSSCKP
jgi:hypothetical protein